MIGYGGIGDVYIPAEGRSPTSLCRRDIEFLPTCPYTGWCPPVLVVITMQYYTSRKSRENVGMFSNDVGTWESYVCV